MALQIVDPTSTETEHTTSVDVKHSGTHIGGGIYFSANHFPTPGGTSTAVPQSSLNSEGESHATAEYDFTLPTGDDPWLNYREESTGDSTITSSDVIMVGYDISMHVGDRLSSTGEFYDGPAISLLIMNDPTDLSGTVTITGYPTAANSLNGMDGVLHETSGALVSYGTQDVSGDPGGYFTVDVDDVVGGMSGGGNFIDFDADGDGTDETYLIGATSRTVTIDNPFPVPDVTQLQSAAFAPQYADMAATIESLTGLDARTADDFARMTLMSAQTLGSGLTTVQGQFFHENLFGGVNADTMMGAGGDDLLVGRGGADSLTGGTGQDTLNGGDGADTMAGGTGADFFSGDGFGNSATDVIEDFDGTEDIVDLSSFFATFSQVTSAATQQGDGSLHIDLGSGTLVLESTTTADLNTTNTNVVCFGAGTRIATPAGERLVEHLTIGDRVTTLNGSPTTVLWIGRQTLHKTRLGARMQPVRIRAGALGHGVPNRDLTVTADHGMIIDGHVITAAALVNHDTIDFVPLAELDDSFTVFHVETARHDVIFANNAASETFVDAITRSHFDNHAEYLDLYGADRIIPEMALPRVSSKRLLPTKTMARLNKTHQNRASIVSKTQTINR